MENQYHNTHPEEVNVTTYGRLRWYNSDVRVKVSKIYNRMLLNRVYELVNALLRPEQAGFRRGRRCTEQIHTLRRMMEGFYKKQLPLISTFVDFKKTRMSEILCHYGIPEKIVTAIMEMYKDTSSRVMVNGQFSKLFYITKGVLQGTP